MAVTNDPATEDEAARADGGSVTAPIDTDAVSTTTDQEVTPMADKSSAMEAVAFDWASPSAAAAAPESDAPPLDDAASKPPVDESAVAAVAYDWASPGTATAALEGDAPPLNDIAQSPSPQQVPMQWQAEIDRLNTLLLRTHADNENLRKRSAREVEQARKYALERIVSELLAVKDSMDLGIAACQEEGVDLERIREGMELTLKMLHQVFDKFGVQMLAPSGEAFDPQFHEAMTVQESTDVAAGTVLHVIQKGYLLNGRLVRPAKVIVAK